MKKGMARQTSRKRKPEAPIRSGALLKGRTKSAEEMAKSPTMTVTLRIPSAFNEWLDAYRHLSYPERLAKQDLVVEGLKMVYLRRGGPGETVLQGHQVVTQRRPRS